MSNDQHTTNTAITASRSWPCRRDADYADADPRAVRVGDTCREWTVIAKATVKTAGRPLCHDLSHGHKTWDNGEFPAYYCDTNGGQLADNTPPEREYPEFTLLCSCGSVKVTADPFMSRRCMRHYQRLDDFRDLCESLLYATSETTLYEAIDLELTAA